MKQAYTDLAPPPRRVPMTFRLAELLPVRWWYVWILFIVAIPPIALWIQQPLAFAAVAIITLAGIYAVQLCGARVGLGLLKFGQAADVFESENDSGQRGTTFTCRWRTAGPSPASAGAARTPRP